MGLLCHVTGTFEEVSHHRRLGSFLPEASCTSTSFWNVTDKGDRDRRIPSSVELGYLVRSTYIDQERCFTARKKGGGKIVNSMLQ